VFVYLDLFLLLGPITILALNVGGRNVTELPLGRGGGLYAAALTGVLFISGIGYLHALGALRPQSRE
jgi:hypothetical protein